jgi:hypothetical protein
LAIRTTNLLEHLMIPVRFFKRKKDQLRYSKIIGSLIYLASATIEIDWLCELLINLSIVEKLLLAILINCDNQTVIVKVDSSNDNIKSKYTSKTVKVCQKMRNSRVIILDYIQTEKNLNNLFTKGLSSNVIDAASKEMELRPI